MAIETLEQVIINKISKEGMISCRDFMQMALYHPALGYYTLYDRTGITGDYYTSPEVSNLFGYALGKQVEEMYGLLQCDSFAIVEYGAGQGALCRDILHYLENNTGIYNNVQYYIIEKNYSRRQQFHEKVIYVENIHEINGFCGCVVSNELIDNFPVHVVEMKKELMEVFVQYNNGFSEVLMPASQSIKDYLQQHNITLPEDYRTEINLDARDWIREIAASMQKGFVITIDYGYTAEELYSAQRSTGTLTCYHSHTKNYAPYSRIGMQDITAHVNFSALYVWGKAYGLDCTGFCNQYYFLHALGITGILQKMQMNNMHKSRSLLFQANQLLYEMGNKFKVLIMHKGTNAAGVTGMMFGRRSV